MNKSAVDINVMQMIKKFVISGETSELTGMLSATIIHKKLSDKKDSIARLILSPTFGGDENVKIAKNVMTILGMMTLNKKNPGCRRTCTVKVTNG